MTHSCESSRTEKLPDGWDSTPKRSPKNGVKTQKIPQIVSKLSPRTTGPWHLSLNNDGQNSQHSVDEVQPRRLQALELGLLELELHDHRSVDHVNLAQYLCTSATICSWTCGTGARPSTGPSVCVPPCAGGESLRGLPVDVALPPVVPLSGSATLHHSMPSAILPRSRMTYSGTGTSTSCSTSSCGSESSLRCGSPG